MKKKILGGLAVLAIAAIAAWNVNFGSKTEGMMSDVKLANVQALADCEDSIVINGTIITVTVCNRRTSVGNSLTGICCGDTDDNSCSFTNVGNGC